jgi:hypothetical protein
MDEAEAKWVVEEHLAEFRNVTYDRLAKRVGSESWDQQLGPAVAFAPDTPAEVIEEAIRSIDLNGYRFGKGVDWAAEEGGSLVAWVMLYYGDPRRRSKVEASFVMAPDGSISD